jgi:hypothetical protein
MRKTFLVSLLIVLIAVMSRYIHSRSPGGNTFGDWQYSDVRVIDPIDAGYSGPEIVAVLAHYDFDTLKIRIDFLELFLEHNFDLYIYIDSKPGGNEIAGNREFRWDYLIKYTNTGMTSVVSEQNIEIDSAKLRTTKDLIGNNLQLTFGLTNNNIDTNATVLLQLSTSPGSMQIIDQIGPFLLGGSPPPPIEVAFLFWNVMDGSTPATMLRGWAGAHTGPQSSRHGLSYLLNAVVEWNIPINICNFYDRDIVFALEYLQVWPMINELENEGLVHTSYSCSKDRYAEFQADLITSNQTLGDPSILVSQLVGQYFSGSKSQQLIGGNLSKSILGSPEKIHALFSYITTHPWIHIDSHLEVQKSLLETYPSPIHSEARQSNIPFTITGAPIPSGLTNFEIQTSINSELTNLPRNSIGIWAEQIFINILESEQANITIAQGSYLSQLGHFIEAAYWADHPSEINTCLRDIDWDGQLECILASPNTFMTFELNGGYLAFAFHINANGIHQIIGPTTQFGILRSDPSTLIIERGIAGDPGQIIGAFADPLSSLQQYQSLSVSSSQIELISRYGNIHKSFSIQDGIIHIIVSDSGQGDATVYKLPIVLDPWLIYTNISTNLYWDLSLGSHWIWRTGDYISIGVSANTNYEHYTFNATYYALLYPEDPNFDYTPGHLLPIPMALVEFQAQPIIIVDLIIDP